MEWVEPWLEHARGKKRESEVLEEGAYAGTKKEELTEEVRRTDSQGLCSPKKAIVLELFILAEGFSSPAQDKAILSFHVVMELNLNCLPDDAVHYHEFMERIQMSLVEQRIELQDTKIVREVIMIPHLPNSMNREDGLVLNKS